MPIQGPDAFQPEPVLTDWESDYLSEVEGVVDGLDPSQHVEEAAEPEGTGGIQRDLGVLQLEHGVQASSVKVRIDELAKALEAAGVEGEPGDVASPESVQRTGEAVPAALAQGDKGVDLPKPSQVLSIERQADLQAARQALEPSGIAQVQQALTALAPEAFGSVEKELAQLEEQLTEVLGAESGSRADEKDEATSESEASGERVAAAGGSGVTATGGVRLDQPVEQTEGQKRFSGAVGAVELQAVLSADLNAAESADVRPAGEASVAESIGGPVGPAVVEQAIATAPSAEIVQIARSEPGPAEAQAVESVERLSAEVTDESRSVDERLQAAEALLQEAEDFLSGFFGDDDGEDLF